LSKNKSLTSLEKGLEILVALYSIRPELSTKEIAEFLNIPLSTTYRYLEILMAKGFLAKDLVTKRIVVGPAIFRFAHAASSHMSLVNLASPHMEKLTVNSGETAFLYVVHGFDAICIGKTEARQGIRMSLPLGSSLPLHAGASAKILLAYQDKAFLESLLKSKGLAKFTENTVTSPRELKQQLAEIRMRGYATSDSEANPGATAIAAPIRGIGGKVVAGLSLGGPSERIHHTGMAVLAEMVVKTAQEISQDLGCLQDLHTGHSQQNRSADRYAETGSRNEKTKAMRVELG
jgi:IclR family KDG regulon transcriptional repressor